MAWTITPTLFLRLTFDIANNDNTKVDRAKEEREGVGDGYRAQHMTQHKNKKLPGHAIFYEHI
jgi:hypothetical protein